MVRDTIICEERSSLAARVERFERSELVKDLRARGGNQLQTALAIGVHRNTLARKIYKYRITWKEIKAE